MTAFAVEDDKLEECQDCGWTVWLKCLTCPKFREDLQPPEPPKKD